jgi:hypothetical protein
MKEEDFYSYLGFILFGISELLPFCRVIKSNGFCDGVWCALCNSQCVRDLGEPEMPDNVTPEDWVASAA